MEKQNIDWSNLGFGYMPTGERFVSNYKDGKWDATTILAELDLAMKSNADNTVINHTDANGSTHDVLGWDEPVDYSPLFSV